MSSQEVTHTWAHRRQPLARNSNKSLYFGGDTIFSYGSHFPIARHLNSGTIAITTSSASITTGRHINLVRRAIPGHKKLIFVSSPCMTAGTADRDRAESEATQLLESAAKRRSPARRDDDRASALNVAEQFNAYAEAIGSGQRIDTARIASADLAALRMALVRRQEQEAIDRRRLEAEAGVRLAKQVESWRNFGPVPSQEIRSAPVALRYFQGANTEMSAITTSRGAEIPEADARRLWPVIRRVMAGECDHEISMRLGHYRLTKIRPDGSIVVDCHDIAFAEIERIAERLGLVPSAVAA